MPASPGGERRLTDGEVVLARSVFGTAIDYERVTIRRRKFFPLQPRHVTMAPRGHLHFHPLAEAYSDDFSTLPPLRQGLFIHEMTHVWQAQRGGRFYLPMMRHPFCRYDYRLEPGKPFARYGIEQQAEIVTHRFLADRGAQVPALPPRELLPFA